MIGAIDKSGGTFDYTAGTFAFNGSFIASNNASLHFPESITNNFSISLSNSTSYI